jgi:hypothetical protein
VKHFRMFCDQIAIFNIEAHISIEKLENAGLG